jgi:putative Mn2+ efflux pump MntP
LNLIDIVILGIALGIDCTVVSFSQGLIIKKKRLKNSLSLAGLMGLFQGGMPLIGYVGTDYIYKLIVPYTKWIVFGIFFILGWKFILEAFEPKKEEVKCLDLKCLIILSIATSIDALASGATLRLTNTNLLLATLIIGFFSFIMSFFGFWSGNKIKSIPSKYLEILGGLLLLGLAIKALIV